MLMNTFRNQRGFTLVELLVATTTTVVVLGAAVALTNQIQNGYRRQLEDAAAEQEGRYALDWIGRYLRAADNDPYGKANNPGNTPCPGVPLPQTPIAGIQFDPDADGDSNDIRLMTDANPPDGMFGGAAAGACNQANEDVTISHNNVNNTILFLDNNTGGAVATRTDTVIEDLNFVFRNSTRGLIDPNDPLTGDADDVVWVETQITIRTRTIDVASGQPMRRLLTSEVRVRSR
jgi:type II secretory pathway pseudopilin PulG